MRVDLHCHSLYSDGLDDIDALLQQALANGVDVLALTDHDTTEGVSLLQNKAKEHPIRIISGIEFSARWKKYDVHILGLGVDIDAEPLNALIAEQAQHRETRGQAISNQLASVGVLNAYEKACEFAGHKHVARPHFAAVLVQEGKVPDVQTAFKRYLKSGRLAYVPTLWPDISRVVEVITQSFGLAVIAHPLKYALTRTKLHEFIKTFKEAGGLGLEVVSGLMETSAINELGRLCQRFDLLASTGSDYHGLGLSRVRLGQQADLPKMCNPIWQAWDKIL